MFTDLVSSTQELERHGDVGWKRLLERHDAALLRLVGRFGGTYVNTTGDGMVATFDTPSRALGCAVAIRSAARQLALGVRIGLHTGEIELRDADITGIAVVVAARVVATASPGEILVTATVRDLAAGSGHHFEDRGLHGLKGLTTLWQLLAVD
jgi:class 3 adenylate cyclase